MSEATECQERPTAQGPASLGMLAHRWWAISGLWVLGLVGIGLSLVLPDQVGRLTDVFGGVQRVTWEPVVWAVASMVGAQLGLSLVTFLRTKGEVSLREAVTRQLTLDLMGRILRFGADFFREQEAERINNRALEDSGRASNLAISAAVTVPMSGAAVVVFAAVMIANNWFLGIVMVLLAGLSGYFVLFDRQIQSANRQARETHDAIRVGANEIVAGVSEIRNHFAYDYALGGLRKSFDSYLGVMKRVERLMAAFGAIDPLVTTIQIGALLALGAALCMEGSPLASLGGRMTWGEVVKFMLLAQLFQRPVDQIATQILHWRMGKESLRRVKEYYQTPCVFQPRPGARPLAEGALDVAYRAVSFVTPGGAGVIRDVEMAVPHGEHVVLCGPSGCGKSTLLHMLVRAVDPSSGTVALNGLGLDQYDVHSLASDIGLVPQNPILFNTSIRSNLLLGLRRPSATAVPDQEGPIDVRRLPGVRTADDLNRRLVEIVTSVGLAPDVVRKCMDSRLPLTPQAGRIRRDIRGLRRRLADLAGPLAADLLCPFDRGRWFPGSVGENLFGPGPLDAGLACRELLAAAGTRELAQDLLLTGYRRVRSEKFLAARVGQRRPGLLAFLPGHDALADQAAERTDLDHMPESLRAALMEVAMETDADTARDLAGSDAFGARVLEARGRLQERLSSNAGAWDIAKSGEYADNLTLRENFLAGRANPHVHDAPERLDEFIQQVLLDEGLQEEAILLGLEYQVGEGGKLLSGGQRQKIAIARVVLKSPRLLLLDEATASLDELSQSRVMRMVAEDFRDCSVISISHRLGSISQSDRVVVLDRGQVAQQGKPQELTSQEGLFRDMFSQEQGQGQGQPQPAKPPSPMPLPGAAEPGGMQMELRRRIAMAPLFAGLQSDQLAFVQSVMKIIQCGKDEVLFRRGDAGRQFYLILDGAVDFFVDQTGQGGPPAVVNSAGPGEVFGELAVFGKGLRTVGARARTDATLGLLDHDDLLKVIHADPDIAISLLEAVSGHLSRTCDKAYADTQANSRH